MKRLILILALLTNLCLADDHEDLVHFSAHFGMSYAINTVVYGSLRSLSYNAGKSEDANLRLEEMVFSAAFTLMVGYTYKYIEGANTSDTLTAMKYNSIGVGAAALSFEMFRW